MILTAIVNNRTVSFAFFEAPGAGEPLSVFRVAAAPRRTADEYAALLCAMPERPQGDVTVTAAVVASVVPLLTPEIVRAVGLLYPGADCFTVGAGLRSGLSICTDAPAELGADLVALAAGAVAVEKPPLLVLNCGDVTTLSAIGAGKENPVFLGCAILPGATLEVQALREQAALLSAVALARPARAIGTNTADSVRAGVLRGHAAAIERLIGDFEAEMGEKELPVIATGEEIGQLLPLLGRTVRREEELAHKGLFRLALLNAKKQKRPKTGEENN